MAENKVTYKYLDVARGLALLLVMISHAHGLNRFLIYYYIQVFFIISGYTYRPGRGTYGETIKKKAKRLLIPYFGYSALLWCFYALIRRDGAAMKQSLFGVFYSRFCLYKTTTHEDNVYLLDIANGAMWYLTAFFVTSLIFYLVADKCLSSWKICTVTSIVLLVATGILNGLTILLPWSIDTAGIAAVLMLIGALLRKYEFFDRPFSFWMVAGALVLYVSMVEFNGRLNMSIREYGKFEALSIPFFLVVSVTGSMLCIWVSKWIQNTVCGKFLSYLGTHTIELMCLHMVGLEVFEIVASRFVDVNAFTGAIKWIYVAVRVTAAVGAALAGGAVIHWLGRRFTKTKRGLV